MSSLFILRTPLQAWIAEILRDRELCARFSVIYVTVQNALEDRQSFQRFSIGAEKAWYVDIKSSVFDVFFQFELYRKLEKIRCESGNNWAKIFVASFDAHGINAMVRRCDADEIVGFDDGTANINSMGLYSADYGSRRERVYRWALGGLNNRKFIESLSRHYTIFGNSPHIVPASKLLSLDLPLAEKGNSSQGVARYFIGQPLREVLNSKQLRRLVDALRCEHVQWYVPHPREPTPLGLEQNEIAINKDGYVAEVAIAKHARGKEIWLYGWFSTVMFTMAPLASKRIMYLPYDHSDTSRFAAIAKNSGCEIVIF